MENLNESKIGCGVHLNPNGSDLRCGQKINNLNCNANEGVVQLCAVCALRKQNKALLDMLNSKRGE